jgi:hypothetical protein
MGEVAQPEGVKMGDLAPGRVLFPGGGRVPAQYPKGEAGGEPAPGGCSPALPVLTVFVRAFFAGFPEGVNMGGMPRSD